MLGAVGQAVGVHEQAEPGGQVRERVEAGLGQLIGAGKGRWPRPGCQAGSTATSPSM
jgi:hypothetical protein